MNEMVQCNFMKKKKLASANRAAELQSAIKNIPFESVTVEGLRKQTPEIIGVHSDHILEILENANNAKEKHSKKKREDKVPTQEKSKTLNQEFNHQRVMRQYTRLAIAAVESVLTWATTVVKVNAVSPGNHDVQSLKWSKPIPNLPFEEKPPKEEILNAATLEGVAASETISSNHKMDEHGSIVIDSDDEPHSDFGSPGTESLSMDDNLRALRSLHEKYANIHLEKNSADQIRLLTAALDGRTHANKVRNSATLTQSTEFKKSRTSLDSISISSKSSRSSRSSGSGSSDSGTDSGSDSESGSSSSDDDSASSDTMSAKSVNGDKSPASMPLDEFVPPTAAASTATWGPTGSDRTEDDSASCTEEETPYSNACKRPHRKSRSTRTHSQKSTGVQTDTPAVCSDSSAQESAQQEKCTNPRMPKIIYPTIKTICNDSVLMEESQLICVKDPCVKAGIEKILVKDNCMDVSIDETLEELSRGLDYIRHSIFPEPNECQNLGYVSQDDPEFFPVKYPSAGPEYGRTRSFEYSQPDYLDIVDKEISDDDFPPRRMPYLPYQSRTHSYTSEYIKNKNILAPADKSMVRPAHEDQPSPTPSSHFPPTLPVKVSKSILRHERKINVRKKIKFSSEIMEELRLRDEDNGGSLSESSSESAEKSFECDICHKWFSTLVTMKIHRRVHVLRPSGSSGSSSRGRRRVPERYECDCCDATFSRRERLMNHKAEAHRNAMTIRCDVCRRCFEDERELAAHAARHTADERAGRCADCGRVLPSWDELKRHRQAAHPTVMKSDRSRGDGSLSYRPGTNMSQRHLCRLCGKGFGHAHSLTRHLANHSKAIYKCVVCKQTFNQSDELAQHLNSHLDRYKRLKP